MAGGVVMATLLLGPVCGVLLCVGSGCLHSYPLQLSPRWIVLRNSSALLIESDELFLEICLNKTHLLFLLLNLDRKWIIYCTAIWMTIFFSVCVMRRRMPLHLQVCHMVWLVNLLFMKSCGCLYLAESTKLFPKLFPNIGVWDSGLSVCVCQEGHG